MSRLTTGRIWASSSAAPSCRTSEWSLTSNFNEYADTQNHTKYSPDAFGRPLRLRERLRPERILDCDPQRDLPVRQRRN